MTKTEALMDDIDFAGHPEGAPTGRSGPSGAAGPFDLAERLDSGETYTQWVHRLSHPAQTPDQSECVGYRRDGSFGRQAWSEERDVYNPLRLPDDELLDGRRVAVAYIRAAMDTIYDSDRDPNAKTTAAQWLERAAYAMLTDDNYLSLLTLHGRDGEPPRLMVGNDDDLNQWSSLLRMATEPVTRAVAAAAGGSPSIARGVMIGNSRTLRRMARRSNGGNQ